MNETLYGARKPALGYERGEDEDSDLVRLEFRQPRDTLLCVVAEFLTKCSARLADLSKKIPDLPSKATELLDVKCHLVGRPLNPPLRNNSAWRTRPLHDVVVSGPLTCTKWQARRSSTRDAEKWQTLSSWRRCLLASRSLLDAARRTGGDADAS